MEHGASPLAHVISISSNLFFKYGIRHGVLSPTCPKHVFYLENKVLLSINFKTQRSIFVNSRKLEH